MSNDNPLKEFVYNEKEELICAKCGSKNLALLPKMYFTYYVCKDCGNEEQF